MGICNNTYKLFPKKQIELIEEKINSFQLEYTLDGKPNFEKYSFEDYLKSIKNGDDFKLSIQIEDNDPVVIVDVKKSDEFISELNSSFQYYESNEEIKFKLTFDKSVNNDIRNIYHFESFVKFWNELSISDLLNILKPILKLNNSILFKYLEPEKKIIHTSNLYFDYKMQVPITKRNIKTIRDNCHFGNIEEFPFTPDFFYINNPQSSNNSVTEKLTILCSLFSIISLFDITSISENKLFYKLNGYKTFEGTIEINHSFLECSSTFYQLYDWVYSSDGNTADKIGLVRNILSIYLEDDITRLDKNILISIKSAYKTYLKENVGEYLEIRNKIFDELSWVSQKSSEIVEKYLSNYQKSIFTFLSFFISVFIIRVLQTSDFVNVFSKDATVLSFAFLIISAIFLGFSKWTLNKEKSRLRRKYSNIKNRYKDLLIEKDIDKILDNDKEFLYEISFINKRHKAYTRLWIITLVILLASILTISDYINWSVIINTIKEWFILKKSN